MSCNRTLALLLTLAGAALALAATPVTAGAAAAQARVRLIYLAPDQNPSAYRVDFYVDGRRVWSNVLYKTVSTYLAVTTGVHDFQVRRAGTPPASSPLTDVQQTLDASYYSVFAAGKAAEGVQVAIFKDGFPNPPAGKAVARFVHMAPEVPGVNVELTDRTKLFTDIGFLGASDYSPFPPGTYPVQLVGVRDPVADQVLFQTDAVLKTAGAIYTLIGIGGVGQPVQLMEVLDAGSVGLLPSGGAGTGEGGTAYGEALLLGLAAASLLAAALLLLLVRRQPVRA